MPPNQEVVWAVNRTCNFAGAERPSLQTTLEALHRKYGPETVPADPAPRNSTKSIVWVYAQGKPMGPAGQKIYQTCGTFGNHFGNGDLAAVDDIATGGDQREPTLWRGNPAHLLTVRFRPQIELDGRVLGVRSRA